MTETIFDLIVAGKIPSWTVWQDDDYLAFLTPYPNTPGMTVVVPKINPGSYLFSLDDLVLSNLVLAAKKVARLLEKSLKVSRVAMVVEGTGIAYCHVKLYPLHGKLGSGSGVWSSHQEFYPEYVGYLSTAEGPKMPDSELSKLQQRIKKANNEN